MEKKPISPIMLVRPVSGWFTGCPYGTNSKGTNLWTLKNISILFTFKQMCPALFSVFGGGGKMMMGSSSKTNVVWSLGHTCKPTTHHICSKGIQASSTPLFESHGMCWCDFLSAAHLAGGTQILEQYDVYSAFQRALNWPKWNSQYFSNFMESDSSVSKDKSTYSSSHFHAFLNDGHPRVRHLRPLLNLGNQSKPWVPSIVCSPKATNNISEVYTTLFTSSQQNLVQANCSFSLSFSRYTTITRHYRTVVWATTLFHAGNNSVTLPKRMLFFSQWTCPSSSLISIKWILKSHWEIL
jgi:hypothetical protein